MKRLFPLLTAGCCLAFALTLLGRTAFAATTGLDITQSGSGLLVMLVNSTSGTAVEHQDYATDASDCGKQTNPCFIFAAIDGLAPMPVTTSVCEVENVGNAPTAYCKADGVSSVTVEAMHGGSIGYDASGDSEMGKHCFPVPLNYKAGGRVFSVLAHDGCSEAVSCAARSFGTVDADSSDSVDSNCKYVQRH